MKLQEQLEKRLPSVALFQLADIPGVMRSRLGWPVAASFMDRWFRSPKFEMSLDMKRGGASPYLLHQLPEERLEENLATMTWALGFPRVRAAMLDLQMNWATARGLKLLRQRILKQGIGKTGCWRFGDLGRPAKEVDNSCQVNFAGVGKLSDPMDDFYAALGEASIKMAISGIVTSNTVSRVTIEVDELGFYLRDTYDFNDDLFISQPLGFWSFNGVERNARFANDVFTTPRFVHDRNVEEVRGRRYLVQNKHFRLWREQHGRGGDFMVISDMHRIKLPKTIKYDF
ncbi:MULTISPECIES: DUF6402 family protein [unclassified Acidovorax]|uniref:DUF6402 family protein n=1 Tax=unclassified Acidovorax TaxID=2684926 RepID=UPI001F4757B5|nr:MULTISPECIES: DUF6402 family protein [unclassified Acidovorax]